MTSDSDLLELGKEVHNCLSKGRGNTCRYGVGNEDGEVRTDFHTACHAALIYYKKDGSPPLVISNQVQTKYPGWIGDKEMSEYYSFLFTDSVFADCYVTKDPDKCVEDGVTVRTDRPANLVAAACIATRQAWEYGGVGLSVNRLIKFGLDPRRAHLAAHLISVNKDGTFLSSSRSGHIAVYSYLMGGKAISNFLSGTLGTGVSCNLKTYMNMRTYGGIPNMWGKIMGGGYFRIRNEQGDLRINSDPFNFIKRVGLIEKRPPDVVEVVDQAIERMIGR